MWVLPVDDLLALLSPHKIEFQVYTDDVAVVVQAESEKLMSNLLQIILTTKDRWSENESMFIHRHKLVFESFSRKRKLKNLKRPTLIAVKITFADEAKYFELTLDKK